MACELLNCLSLAFVQKNCKRFEVIRARIYCNVFVWLDTVGISDLMESIYRWVVLKVPTFLIHQENVRQNCQYFPKLVPLWEKKFTFFWNTFQKVTLIDKTGNWINLISQFWLDKPFKFMRKVSFDSNARLHVLEIISFVIILFFFSIICKWKCPLLTSFETHINSF